MTSYRSTESVRLEQLASIVLPPVYDVTFCHWQHHRLRRPYPLIALASPSQLRVTNVNWQNISRLLFAASIGSLPGRLIRLRYFPVSACKAI
jgi:hypothetical protein